MGTGSDLHEQARRRRVRVPLAEGPGAAQERRDQRQRLLAAAAQPERVLATVHELLRAGAKPDGVLEDLDRIRRFVPEDQRGPVLDVMSRLLGWGPHEDRLISTAAVGQLNRWWFARAPILSMPEAGAPARVARRERLGDAGWRSGSSLEERMFAVDRLVKDEIAAGVDPFALLEDVHHLFDQTPVADPDLGADADEVFATALDGFVGHGQRGSWPFDEATTQALRDRMEARLPVRPDVLPLDDPDEGPDQTRLRRLLVHQHATRPERTPGPADDQGPERRAELTVIMNGIEAEDDLQPWVEQLLASGTAPGALLADLHRVAIAVRPIDRIDCALDVMDRLIGDCRPDQRLLPEAETRDLRRWWLGPP